MNESLITDNLSLIYLSIKQLNLTWTTEDEFQEYYDAGLEGLIRGAKSFDTLAGYKVSTYLTICIKNEIKKFLCFKTMPKRYNPAGKDISLDSLLIDDENNPRELIDVIPDPSVNIEEQIQQKAAYENILNAIEHLKNSEDKICLKYRFGLVDGKCYTLQEIAEKTGVSKQRINQKVKRAIREIKAYLLINKDVYVHQTTKPKLLYRKEKQMKEPEKIKTLFDLNSVLFEQISKICDENSDLDKEIRKSKAISQLAQQIVANTNTCIKAMKLVKDKEIKNDNELNLLGLGHVD